MHREVLAYKLDGQRQGRTYEFHNKLALTLCTNPDSSMSLYISHNQYTLGSCLAANPRGTAENYPMATTSGSTVQNLIR